MQNKSIDSYAEFLVLNYINIKYIVPSGSLANIVDRNLVNIGIIIRKLVKEGYISEHENSYSLTELGKEKLKFFLREIINKLTEEEKDFLKQTDNMLNDIGYFLQYTVTKYQLKADSQKDIIKSLEDIHNEIELSLKKLILLFPHFKLYLDRIKEALSKIKEGNTLYIVYDPNSYYYVFYELHTDIKNFVSEIK